MSRRTNGSGRRKLRLERETLRRLSARDLGQVAGGTGLYTQACVEDSCDCFETADCTNNGYSTGTRYC